MSCAFSWPLQQALHAALVAHPVIVALAGGRVFDDAPARETLAQDAAVWVVIGDEEITPWSTATDVGAAHVAHVGVVSTERGFATAKRVADAVCEVVLGPLALTRGRVASAGFLGARTRRVGEGAARRIDLRFRLAVEDTI